VYDRIWQSPLKRGIWLISEDHLSKVRRKEGETWVLRYRVPTADGRRVEHKTPIGLVRKFPKDEDAWREVDRLRILIRINDPPSSSRIRFDSLAEQLEFRFKTAKGSDFTTSVTRSVIGL
jgi:hypothetical protein